MCYSARVRQDLRQLSKRHNAKIAWEMFEQIFRRRAAGEGIKVARALEANFLTPTSETEERTKGYIEQYWSQRTSEWETEIFAQRRRLVKAEETLKVKETKKALEDCRISSNKILQLKERLADCKRSQPVEDDERIFPMTYAPILVYGKEEPVIVPMRYGCRLAGKPANYDARFPGTYNARRDSLDGFWKNVYGHRHGVMVISGFFENVPKHLYEHQELAPEEKPENLVLQFSPRPRTEMLVACVWDRWRGEDGQELYSYAAVTDEPPEEIAATGHQRCVIALREENLAEWLNPKDVTQERLEAILSDRERPFYEHRVAA